MIEMVVKALTPPRGMGLGDHTIGGGGLGNREPGSYIYIYIYSIYMYTYLYHVGICCNMSQYVTTCCNWKDLRELGGQKAKKNEQLCYFAVKLRKHLRCLNPNAPVPQCS